MKDAWKLALDVEGGLDFKEYIPLAMRTDNPKETELDDILNVCLGLVGEYVELTEFMDKYVIKDELSDLYWYTARLHKTLETDAEPIRTQAPVLAIVGLICDTTKKWAFQGHEYPKEKLTHYSKKLLYALNALCEYHGFTPSEVMEHNIAKLKKRYPEGFSSDKSINRVEAKQLTFDDMELSEKEREAGVKWIVK